MSRESSCVLRLLGLNEFIAFDVGEYVRIAAAHARDQAGLAALRSTLRDRIKRSPLFDAAGLTRKIEDAYRRIWIEWCHGRVLDVALPKA